MNFFRYLDYGEEGWKSKTRDALSGLRTYDKLKFVELTVTLSLSLFLSVCLSSSLPHQLLRGSEAQFSRNT